MTHQHSAVPQPVPDSVISGGAGASSSSPLDPAVSVINTSLASSVTGSERTVIETDKKTEEVVQGWSNTLDSNMTDNSVEEPKYAKVTHKKRNSKICSGNSTPKVKRRELSGTKLSRLVLCQMLSSQSIVSQETLQCCDCDRLGDFAKTILIIIFANILNVFAIKY